MKDYLFDLIPRHHDELQRPPKRNLFWNLLCSYNPKPSSEVGNIKYILLDKHLCEVSPLKILKLSTTRFLNRKLKLNDFLTDKIIREIADSIYKEYWNSFEIRLDKGSQITKNYKDAIGGHSCMTESCARCTKLYEMNPDRFEQLIVKSGNNSARAIVSLLDGGKKYCDRVYSTSEYVSKVLEEYVEEQGWYMRDDDNDYPNLTISNLNFHNGNVPYMDTFEYCKITNNKLTIATSLKNYDGCLRSCNGFIEELDLYRCYECGDLIDEDCEVNIDDESYCEDCVSNLFFWCEECNDYREQEQEYAINGLNYCKYCFEKIGAECEDCGKYIYNEDSVTAEHKIICTECLENYYTCDNCGNVVEEVYENDLCDDCYDEEIIDEEKESS